MPIKAVHLDSLRKRLEPKTNQNPLVAVQSAAQITTPPVVEDNHLLPKQNIFNTIKVTPQVATALSVVGVFVFTLGAVAFLPNGSSQAAEPPSNENLIEAVGNLRAENTTLEEELQATKEKLRDYQLAEALVEADNLRNADDQASEVEQEEAIAVEEAVPAPQETESEEKPTVETQEAVTNTPLLF